MKNPNKRKTAKHIVTNEEQRRLDYAWMFDVNFTSWRKGTGNAVYLDEITVYYCFN